MFELGYSIFNIFCNIILSFTFILIISHIISKVYLQFKSHLKLNKNSFVIITGGCMGIGKQMALQIAKLYHCKIMIVDIRKDLFQENKIQIQNLGAFAECYFCDLADDQSVQEFTEHLKQKKQNIDLLILNAAVHIPKRILQTSQKQTILQYKVNVLSSLKLIKGTINLLQNGHIGIISSMVVFINGTLNMGTYSSTKYALYGFINTLRQQFKLDNIPVTISLACPYMIKTGMFEGFKTKLDFLFGQLDSKYVGKRLIKQFIQKKQICSLYQYQALIFKLIGLFPTELLDFLSINMNLCNFNDLKDRHNQKINKLKSFDVKRQ